MKSSRTLSIASLFFEGPNLESAVVIRRSASSHSHLDDIIPRTLRTPPRTPSIPPHGHSLFVINHIAQICQRALELPSIDSLSGFTGVFEGDAQVGTVSAGGFALLDRCGCVADLHEEERISWRRLKHETYMMIGLCGVIAGHDLVLLDVLRVAIGTQSCLLIRKELLTILMDLADVVDSDPDRVGGRQPCSKLKVA